MSARPYREYQQQGCIHVHSAKCELDLYEYVLVQTYYILLTQSMYQVHTIFPKYIHGTYWYVLCIQNSAVDADLCSMPVGNDIMCA